MAFRHFGNLAGGGVITSVLYMALSLASTAVLNLIAANGWMVSAALMAAGAALFLLWRKSKKLRWMILGWLSLVLENNIYVQKLEQQRNGAGPVTSPPEEGRRP